MAHNNQIRSQQKKQKPAKGKNTDKNNSTNSLPATIGIVSGIFAILAAIVAIVNGWIEIGLKVSPTPTPPVVTTAAPTMTPEPTATPTPLYTPGPLTFIERPEQINAGNDVRIIVQAWEGALCFIKFSTPDGNESKAEGLGVASPDSLHRCTWVWNINRNTHEGMGSIYVQVGEFEETHPIEILP